jgi:hypothetical protein
VALLVVGALVFGDEAVHRTAPSAPVTDGARPDGSVARGEPAANLNHLRQAQAHAASAVAAGAIG